MTKRDAGERDEGEAERVRTIFLSDVHLGTKGCQAEALVAFLRRYDADTMYLVGDIVDGWALRSAWYWPQAHNDVVQKLLRKVRKGTRLVYVPGNHDEFLRDYVGSNFGGIEIVSDAIHVAPDGRRYYVTHGDQFDLVVVHAKWLALLGDGAYSLTLFLNRHLNTLRRRFGLTYWSLSAWAKAKVKNAVSYIGRYEDALANDAARHQADGVICGHIHHAALRDEGRFTYVNCGDWVESCTGIVEHYDGRMELVRWLEREEPAPARAAAFRPALARPSAADPGLAA